ncbi:glutathione synthetase ATP-binding domain-like protein [Leucogyrophana mollusca]|uniref:Glutathione synthetase ATP-binding domain-like protein n=1 Tax=Leucogyrophana mollusca TaxID=85980 RepID=A0ACB8BWT9_9AGAM|nr:glutathione synthetase ATP-binding domain-like protein [Leucogyrophana mollusca]
MKICVLQSSYDDSNSPFKNLDMYSDPSRWVKKHEFHHRYIHKQTAEQQIDEACREEFDMYLNYMWGQPEDDVAGVEAVKYLESKGVPFIGLPSRFLAKTKLDFRDAARKHGVRVPDDTTFPQIVKLANGCGSMHLTEDSVCYTQEAVEEQVRVLKEKSGGGEVVVQQFVVGEECSAMVLEMGDNVVSLPPTTMRFPDDMDPMKRFLHWGNKVNAVTAGVIREMFVEDEVKASLLKQAAVAAFRALDAAGGGAWARVDMRVDAEGKVYVLEVNPAPALFYPLSDVFRGDHVILESFPGGHEALMDILIVTKLAQMRGFEKQVTGVQSGYEEMAPKYDAISASTNMGLIFNTVASECNMSGSVLDLGCGTGIFGRVLHEVKPEQVSVLTGVDISPAMLASPTIRAHYSTVLVSPMQEAAMTLEDFDHVVVFGCLHFLDPTIFSAVLSRLFFVARRSITISVEDIPERYNDHLRKIGYGVMYSWNHTKAVRDFGVPQNWRVAYDQRFDAWDSPKTGDKVFATILRYERVDAGQSCGMKEAVNGL